MVQYSVPVNGVVGSVAYVQGLRNACQNAHSFVGAIQESLVSITRVSNSYDQPQLPPTKMATAENGETKQSRISGKPDRALCPYDTDMSVSYHTMYFSYDHVF